MKKRFLGLINESYNSAQRRSGLLLVPELLSAVNERVSVSCWFYVLVWGVTGSGAVFGLGRVFLPSVFQPVKWIIVVYVGYNVTHYLLFVNNGAK